MKFFLAIWVTIVASLVFDVTCVRIKRYNKANDAKKGEFPSQVLIKMGPEEWAICGGSIINENWVLTAGHCLRSSEGQKPLTYKLVFGEYNRNVDEGTEIYSDIAEVHLYPKYETVGHSYDMALAKLKTPLNFNDSKQAHIKPACLNLEPRNISGLWCVATGWGRSDRYSTMPAILQRLEMKEFPLKGCADYHKDFHQVERVIDTHICTVSVDNPYPDMGDSYGAACAGDSGGPLQCKVKDTWYQVGVTWSNTDCEQNPSVFNRVDKYAEWIQKTAGYTLPAYCKL